MHRHVYCVCAATRQLVLRAACSRHEHRERGRQTSVEAAGHTSSLGQHFLNPDDDAAPLPQY